MNYVLGFAFTKKRDMVLLIKKNRPEWQAGFLNGVGGKIKALEGANEAMVREGKEETGLELEWEYKGLINGRNPDGSTFLCHLFSCFTDEIRLFKPNCSNDEGVVDLYPIFGRKSFLFQKFIPHVGYLIPYVLIDDHCKNKSIISVTNIHM